MISLKVFLSICLIIPGIFALNCLKPNKVAAASDQIVSSEEFPIKNSKENVVASDGIVSSEEFSIKKNSKENVADSDRIVSSEEFPIMEDNDVKINWGPVWDDVDGNNEFVYKRTEDSKEDNCDAPNGLGLKNLIQEVEKLLPKDKIKEIVKSYSEDPEIKALKAFAKNPKTHKMLEAIEHSKEYQILKDYICHVLHLDLKTYQHLYQSLANPSTKHDDAPEERKGIKGLVKSVNAILPHQQIKELYESLLKTDDELVKAVAHLKSEEFHQLLLNVKNNVPEYQELRKQLIALGIPVEEMRDLTAKSLGWSESFNVVF